ncbi:MAG: C1 family peptidase [Sphaerochaetaceae bacterium]
MDTQEITQTELDGFSSDFSADAAHLVAMHSVVKNGINDSAVSLEAIRADRHEFSLTIEAGDITNQKHSGRCWMFAALNVMRLEVMKKYNLKNFELSQSYPLFYDKLEKSNWFLESILDTLDEPLEGRLVAFLLADPMGDGGQWDMFANLVRKYGVVPKDAMAESSSSETTRELDRYLTVKLREFACTLRAAHEKEHKDVKVLLPLKKQMLNTIYRMLSIALGEPPVRFTWESRDKDGKFIRIADTTPQAFFKECVGMDLDQYVSLINAPTADKPYNRTYTVQYLGNVKGGQPVCYLNLPSSELKKAALAQLQDGKAVWFGSDVGQFSQKQNGLMDLNALDVNHLFDTTFSLDKAQRLDYGESRMTHAMVLTGVNINAEGKIDRWRVENSWGDEVGSKGFFVMTDDWFDEYTYQIVVDRKYLTPEQQEMLLQKPIELKPWDPMGSLA